MKNEERDERRMCRGRGGINGEAEDMIDEPPVTRSFTYSQSVPGYSRPDVRSVSLVKTVSLN